MGGSVQPINSSCSLSKKIAETKMLSILSVLLSLMITTDAYTFVYQPMPMPLYPMYQGVNPVLRGQPETQPIVIQLAEQDCSYGDGTYPDLESGCEKYYVCNGDRSWSYHATLDFCSMPKLELVTGPAELTTHVILHQMNGINGTENLPHIILLF